jgi:hypothetical protein
MPIELRKLVYGIYEIQEEIAEAKRGLDGDNG